MKRLMIAVVAMATLASCEHSISMETTVHEDGQLDKTITVEDKDSTHNIIGLSTVNGWKRTVHTELTKHAGKDTRWNISWSKTFPSAPAANEQLDAPNDTVFKVASSFEKKFRWFYTYIYYADTYRAINTMDLAPTDYVTSEDYAFIERIPSRGKKIARADSLYLSDLNKKLFDVYGLRAIYENYFTLHLQLIHDRHLEPRWADTLRRHKEHIFNQIRGEKDAEDDFLLRAMDSLHIPLPYAELKRNYKALLRPVERKMNFISTANDGKYAHQINMPWTVIRTNADSISGKQLFWKPPVIKFLLKDYTMYAEARTPNLWAFAVSLLIIGSTVAVFAGRRRRQKLDIRKIQ